MAEVLLVGAIRAFLLHVNSEGLESVTISGVLGDNKLVANKSYVVKLTAEDRWEVAMHILHILFKAIDTVCVLNNPEVDYKTTDLDRHAICASTSNHGNTIVVKSNGCLHVQTIHLMLSLRPLQSPVHLGAGVFHTNVSPLSAFQIEHCRLDGHLCINDKRKDGLVFVVDRDEGRDVVAEGELGRKLPLVLLERVALTAAILTTSDHQQALS